MKLPYYLLLTAATLLTACAEKDEKVVAPEIDYSAPVAKPGYVSCNQDGKVVTYRAVAFRRPNPDNLEIQLLDSASGAPIPNRLIRYTKPGGASDSEFKASAITVPPYPFYSVVASTLTKTNQGWSGTFAGDFTPMKSSITYKLRSGTFTDIKE